MEYNKPNFLNVVQIQELLLSGFSPANLMDDRIFPEPYTAQEVFEAILKLNRGVGDEITI